MADEFFVGDDLIAYYKIENDILFLKVLFVLPPATTIQGMEYLVAREISKIDNRSFSSTSYLNV